MLDHDLAQVLFIAILKLGKMRYCTRCSHFIHDAFSDCLDHLLVRSATGILAMYDSNEYHITDVIQIITTHPCIQFVVQNDIMYMRVVRRIGLACSINSNSSFPGISTLSFGWRSRYFGLFAGRKTERLKNETPPTIAYA